MLFELEVDFGTLVDDHWRFSDIKLRYFKNGLGHLWDSGIAVGTIAHSTMTVTFAIIMNYQDLCYGEGLNPVGEAGNMV